MDLLGFRMDFDGFRWIWVDLGGFNMDSGGFRRLRRLSVRRSMAACGGLWQPVAPESWPLKKEERRQRLHASRLAG